MKNLIFLLGALSLALCACDRVTPLNINVYPLEFDPHTEVVSSNSNIRLHVVANSDVPIRRITISSYDAIYLEQLVLDTTLTDPVKSYAEDISYKIPVFGKNTQLEFNSSCINCNGDKAIHKMSFFVTPDGKAIQSKDGITMYSAMSGKFSGFSMKKLDIIPGDSIHQADTLTFFDKPSIDTAQQDVLTREWYSLHGVYFSRSENFNYGEATAATISQTYKASTHYDVIKDVHNDDIILVGTKTEAFGVIKVLVVSDEEGVENDRYVFSIKSFLNSK